MRQCLIDCVNHEVKEIKANDDLRVNLTQDVLLLHKKGTDFAKITDNKPKMVWIDGTLGTLINFDTNNFNSLLKLKEDVNSGKFD